MADQTPPENDPTEPDEAAAAPEEQQAAAEQAAAEQVPVETEDAQPTPVAASEDDLEEVDEDDEDDAPRIQARMDLEVDIVLEGEDPLTRQEAEEAAAAAEAEEEDLHSQPIAASIVLAEGARYRATGKRKTAVARVLLKPGTGAYIVNGKTLDEFFPRPTLQRTIRQPLEAVAYDTRMDVVVRIHGGGVAAQAGALRHGISRALLEADPNLRGELKRRGFLTRDARVKERKKAGLKKARKKPQFSKR